MLISAALFSVLIAITKHVTHGGHDHSIFLFGEKLFAVRVNKKRFLQASKHFVFLKRLFESLLHIHMYKMNLSQRKN